MLRILLDRGAERECLSAVALRRQSTMHKAKDRVQAMWYDTMVHAIKQTIIISEILDTRTRHLVQA